jgi:uncharacterized membrane protein
MDEFGELALREREAKRIARRQWFWLDFAVFLTIQVFLFVVWALSSASYPWFIFPLFGWGIVLAAHAIYAFVVRDPEEILVERAARDSAQRDEAGAR